MVGRPCYIESAQIEVVKVLYQEGYTVDEICLIFNNEFKRDPIYGALKRAKIQLRKFGVRSGNIPWNKGIKLTKEQKSKINLTGLKIGHPWNKGKTGIYSIEHLKKMSERCKNATGEKALNWKGGISFDPYPVEFNDQLKLRTRQRDNFICQFPDCEEKENGRAHDCHHIDYDKENNNPENLISLCYKCHPKTNGKRNYWITYFSNLIRINPLETIQ